MNSISELSLWIEVPVAVLLVLSSLFALCGAIGLLRLKDFFQRMHWPPPSAPGAWHWPRSCIFRRLNPPLFYTPG